MNNYFIQALHSFPRTWFTRPGWLVRKFTNQSKLKSDLKMLNSELSVEELMRNKQFFCNIIFVFFFFYLLVTGDFLKGIFFDFSFCSAICMVPEVTITRLIKKKKATLQKELPDFIDALTIAIDSGMNFMNAFGYLSKKQNGVIGDEARKTSREIRFGIPLEECLENMGRRIDVEEFTKFVSAIKQAKKLGVSIAKTLRIQSNLIRTRRRQRAEELARTASVKISIPLVFFIFPSLLIVYLGPGLLRIIGF